MSDLKTTMTFLNPITEKEFTVKVHKLSFNRYNEGEIILRDYVDLDLQAQKIIDLAKSAPDMQGTSEKELQFTLFSSAVKGNVFSKADILKQFELESPGIILKNHQTSIKLIQLMVDLVNSTCTEEEKTMIQTEFDSDFWQSQYVEEVLAYAANFRTALHK